MQQIIAGYILLALYADVFPKLWILQNVVRSMSKKSRFREEPATDNMVIGSKNSCNLNESTFTIHFDHC